LDTKPIETNRVKDEDIRVLIADDHMLVCLGLRLVLERAGIDVIGDAATGREAIVRAQESVPDVVLLDLVMPDMDGFDVLTAIRRTVPHTKVLVTTAYARADYVTRALSMGAAGFITKDDDPDSILGAVRAVAAGEAVVSRRLLSKTMQEFQGAIKENDKKLSQGIELTPKEITVLRLVARGYDNAAIAEELSLSINTVKAHVSRVLTKLDVPDRTKAAIWAHERGAGL
jgi:DNA-binding NarL/FixJ family response regulator